MIIMYNMPGKLTNQWACQQDAPHHNDSQPEHQAERILQGQNTYVTLPLKLRRWVSKAPTTSTPLPPPNTQQDTSSIIKLN